MKHRFLLLVLLAGTVAFAQDQRITVPYQRFVLKNGLNVILHEDHSIPLVTVNLHFNVGSGNEKPGRTGFAHLFEHLMFEGSKHVPEGKFDEWLEAMGGDNNGSTNPDRTNYWENVPSNALELPLFLDSDRMGFLVDAMTKEKVDGQREVVKNERRQSYENAPYGMASIALNENLYPPKHPYSWPTIGSMADLAAASFDDVIEFFRLYYAPNNTSLSIAGDISLEETRVLVEKWFGGIPAGKPVPPIDAPPAVLNEEKRIVLEDKVSLPRLYMAWLTPSVFTPGDAEMDVLSNILAGGKNSRLYKKLVYDLQIAQDVSAVQSSSALASDFTITVTARQGRTLTEIEAVVQQEIERIRNAPPEQRELQRAVNQIEASFLSRLERIGGFGGKADLLNHYYWRTGNPDYFNEDFSRYTAIAAEDVSAAARTWLRDNGRVLLSVVPDGKTELAATGKGGK